MQNSTKSLVKAEVFNECKHALDAASRTLERAKIEVQLANAALEAVRKKLDDDEADMSSAVDDYSAAGKRRDAAQRAYDVALARYNAAAKF